MSDPSTENADRRRRRTGVLWAGGAIAAAILLLSVSGTLSSWTAAIVDNNQNDVAVKGAVALVETDGTHTCDTGASATNQVSCATINKYGGTVSPLDPDGVNSQTVSVNLANTGTATGNLALTADACVSSAVPASTGADPVGHPVCDVVTVEVACTGTGALDTTGSPAALSTFAGGAVVSLAPGASTDCAFTLTLPAGTPSSYGSQVASQGLHWTLTAA